MNRKIAVFAASLGAFALVGPSAHAGPDDLANALNPFSGEVQISGTIASATTTAAYFAINGWDTADWNAAAAGISQAGALTLTAIGCAAVGPMIATAIVGRPLTYREAGKLTVGCVVPFIGPLIVDALYDAHPEWEQVHPQKVR